MLFGTYDIETAGLGGKMILIGAYDGEDIHYFNDILSFFEYLSESEIKLWYAHNGGKYDIKYLLRYIEDTYGLSLMDINGSLQIKVYESFKERIGKKTGKRYISNEKLLFELRDSFLLVKGSLKQLCYDFDTEHKKMEYDDYEEHKDKKLLREYLKIDCVALYEILEAFFSILDISDKPPYTIAGIALKTFTSEYEGEKYLKLLGKTREFYRYGYFGGRTEVFIRYGENLYYNDINSMYPSVMLTEKYPLGMVYSTMEYMPGQLGYYFIRAIPPDDIHIPVLPMRYNNTLLFPNSIITGWYYSPEIELADKMGYEIDILKGKYWKDSCNPFTEFITHYYELKSNSEGSVKATAKFILNSLYGKMAQNTEQTKIAHRKSLSLDFILDNHVEFIDDNYTFGKYKVKSRYSPFIKPQVPGFITSYARVKLYEYMLLAGLENIYYCDTDSIITSKPLPDKVISKNIGDMKVEHEIEKGIFVSPKVYALITNNPDPKKKIILKAKGFNRDFVDTLSFNSYVKALHGEYEDFDMETVKVPSLSEYGNRHCSGEYHDTIPHKRSMSGDFNKRILLDDLIHTRPLTINDMKKNKN